MKCTYSDKTGQYKGNFDGATFTIWNKEIKKTEYSFSISMNSLSDSLNQNGNSHYAVRELVKDALYKAEDEWVANTKDEKLREDRWRLMYNDSLFGRYGSLDDQGIDSACRVLKELHKKAFGEFPKSWIERIKETL